MCKSYRNLQCVYVNRCATRRNHTKTLPRTQIASTTNTTILLHKSYLRAVYDRAASSPLLSVGDRSTPNFPVNYVGAVWRALAGPPGDPQRRHYDRHTGLQTALTGYDRATTATLEHEDNNSPSFSSPSLPGKVFNPFASWSFIAISK